VKAYLRDESGIDLESLLFSVGTNTPVTLVDPRLTFEDGVLLYTPATTEFLGTNTQTVVASLAVTDRLGNRSTNAWSFQLEQTVILADNVVLIGGDSPLTLVSTNGDTYVFRYTGATSGLTNGTVLVNTETNAPYKRRVLSVNDSPVTQTVTLITRPATIADCVVQGGLRLTDFAEVSNPAGRMANAYTRSLTGTTIPLNKTFTSSDSLLSLRTSGQFSFEPDFSISGEFRYGRLVAFDAEFSQQVALAIALEGSVAAEGAWNGSNPLGTPRRFFKFGSVGPIPVWVEAVLEFHLGYTGQAQAHRMHQSCPAQILQGVVRIVLGSPLAGHEAAGRSDPGRPARPAQEHPGQSRALSPQRVYGPGRLSARRPV
jgi:hypothetical protein